MDLASCYIRAVDKAPLSTALLALLSKMHREITQAIYLFLAHSLLQFQLRIRIILCFKVRSLFLQTHSHRPRSTTLHH